jgi:hypothetical protein
MSNAQLTIYRAVKLNSVIPLGTDYSFGLTETQTMFPQWNRHCPALDIGLSQQPWERKVH